MVYHMFRCMKCIRRLMQLVALHGKPSTRQSMGVVFHSKAARYSLGIGRGNGCGIGLACHYRSCCFCRWADVYAASNSTPHSPHANLRHCFTW